MNKDIFTVMTIGDIEYKGYVLADYDAGEEGTIRQIVYIDCPFKNKYHSKKYNKFYTLFVRALQEMSEYPINNVFSYKGKLCIGYLVKSTKGD